ncbi:hypothetical protein QBC36DRAFT_199588 [Triangularia setosa]|uniref:Tat pathway signal sequence n=1 Tax=Triangularia setosa TaxID=2587417 RepID=A0AAN7A303_9PEZI|nr:hypothetical protein QBC36DRAFT_199588 [Podospora setosa]
MSSGMSEDKISFAGTSEDSDSDHGLELLPKIRQRRSPGQTLLPSIFIKSLFFLLGLILGITIATIVSQQIQQGIEMDLDRQCAMRTSQYCKSTFMYKLRTPVLNEVDHAYSITSFNGSFMKEVVYRLQGSPRVDAAWEALGIEASIIPENEGFASGLTKHHVQRAKKYGGGFFVNVEGLHHLHCLNLVRKSLYFNYNYYKAIGDDAFDLEENIFKILRRIVCLLAHCLDIVRQVLMCNVDNGVLGQVWTHQSNTKQPQAFPDFNTRHKCKNYEAVRVWAEAHQVPPDEELPADYIAPWDTNDVIPYIP